MIVFKGELRSILVITRCEDLYGLATGFLQSQCSGGTVLDRKILVGILLGLIKSAFSTLSQTTVSVSFTKFHTNVKEASCSGQLDFFKSSFSLTGLFW